MAISYEPPRGDVVATLNFYSPPEDGSAPYNLAGDHPPGLPPRNFGSVAHDVLIHDIRGKESSFNLDNDAFQIVQNLPPSAEPSFTDDESIQKNYYPEVERLVKEATGAVRVAIFDHTLRNAAKSARDGSAVREAVQRVHNDYTVRSGPQRVRDLFPAAEAEALLKHRFAMINVWRSIGHTVHDMPLAVADAASVAFEDLVPSDLIYRDRIGETYGVTYSPRHRWFYFPDMEPDEALLIKVYDSDATRSRFSVHTAFADPTAPADAAPRESIEVRTFAFFAPGANDPVPDGPSGLAG